MDPDGGIVCNTRDEAWTEWFFVENSNISWAVRRQKERDYVKKSRSFLIQAMPREAMKAKGSIPGFWKSWSKVLAEILYELVTSAELQSGVSSRWKYGREGDNSWQYEGEIVANPYLGSFPAPHWAAGYHGDPPPPHHIDEPPHQQTS